MKNKKWLIIVISSVFTLLTVSILINQFNDSDGKVSHEMNNKKDKKVYNHTSPKRISKNDYFKWEFISNDIASIYPRRNAIVRDILVDIWDEVNVWDTLAILFNPWVDGEGQSNINIKNTILSSKNNLLTEANKVKEAKINELDQKIIQKEIVLEETIRNYDSKIYQIWNDSTSWSQYQVTVKELENLEWNLINALASKEKLIQESNENINQKQLLLDSKVNEIFYKIIPILYVWNEDELDYKNINSWDFSDQFWAKNTMIKNNLIEKLKKYHATYNELSIWDKYDDLLEINHLLIKTLENTIVSIHVNETVLQDHISNINIYNSELFSQKEVLDDAKNMLSVLEVTQEEKVENIKLQISKKENEISLLWTKVDSTQSEKSLNVSKLKAEIDTLKKSRDLLIANEDKVITTIKNDIAIAKANLNNEYIKSGDYKIISPFSGKISKRWIEIWEKISSNLEAFRISWVDSTLSRITKKEVKFYVPEHLKENIKIDNEIYFSLPDSSKVFTWSIYRISPEIDTDTLSIIVQAKVNDDLQLPNKSTLRVELETQQDIFQIPSSTIYNKQSRKIVYYKKDNWKLWVRDITIISDDGEYSLITWDIHDDIKIVTTPIFIK